VYEPANTMSYVVAALRMNMCMFKRNVCMPVQGDSTKHVLDVLKDSLCVFHISLHKSE
jgi:hypothetical protein